MEDTGSSRMTTTDIASRVGRSLACLAAAFALALPHRARQSATPPADPIPVHDTFTVVSRALGEPRPIKVHTPNGYAEARTTRFPVLYMPDGALDEDFPHVVNTIDSLIALRVIRPVIVVGVPNTQRRRDLTGPTRVASDSAIAPHVGGSAAFRRFSPTSSCPRCGAATAPPGGARDRR